MGIMNEWMNNIIEIFQTDIAASVAKNVCPKINRTTQK